jgi:hypothetical protein
MMSRGLNGRLAKLEKDEVRKDQAEGRPRVVLYLPCKVPVEEGGERQAPGRRVCPHTGTVTIFYDAAAGQRPWLNGDSGDP